MKKNEVRHGNLVIYGGHQTTIDEKEIIHFVRFYDKYEPIPLTEEWLLKFGFERIDGMWTISNFNGYLTKYLPLNGENGYKYFVSHCGMLNIRFVHQLQNIYFALTGEELTI